MKTINEITNEVSKETQRLTLAGRKTYYNFGVEIDPSTASALREYLSSNYKSFQFLKLPCGKFDIIIDLKV